MSDHEKAVLEVLLGIQRELVAINQRLKRIEDGEATLFVNVENSVEVRGTVGVYDDRGK